MTSSSFFLKTVIVVVVLSIQMNAIVVTSANVDTDRLALLTIQSNITHDPQHVFGSWNSSLPLCQWQGVTCGRRHPRVTALDLSGKGLSGSLSPYLGNLTFLKYIDFSNNNFHGSIPPQIGRLSRLQLLSLGRNSFSGEIPDIFSSMLKIKELIMSKNNFTGGIPPSIGNLTSLERLDLSHCQLRGSIPKSFNQLKNLQVLRLGANGLVGSFPSFIFNLSKLQVLRFPQNQLLGHIPSNICSNQSSLRILELGNNRFSGFLPPSISNCSELEILDVSNNDFEGDIDIDFGKLQYLTWLLIGDLFGFETGRLGGIKHFDSLFNCSNLEILQIGAIPLRRELPNSFRNLTKLTSLLLQSSSISGSLPSSIGNLISLTDLFLGGNNFTGMIPESIGMLGNLGNLDLSNNSLEGTIPSSIGACKKLVYLSLHENNLSGSVPKEIFQLSSLLIKLDLSRNNLSGELPKDIGYLENLQSLKLSENHLSGQLPSALSSCISLEFLNISGNFFHGSIPASLSFLRSLEYVDVSHNNFSGHIPTYLQEIPLKQLDLSDNNFDGEVYVKGVFANASALSVIGNPRLCGGIPELHLPICKTKRSRKLSVGVIVAISLLWTVAGLALVSFVLLLYCFTKKKKSRDEPSASTLTEPFEKISYGRLFKATEGFSAANVIGTGGFGSVYKGVLNEKTVAIKVLNLQRRGGSRSFMAECKALRNIRHRNLVKVITCCTSPDWHGNDFKALVYDFMPNGSLETWLHSSTTTLVDLFHQLDLVQRISIAKDVACALDYLHHHCGNTIVHRDLKPSNILLDADMVAHVGDFGLAKLLPLAELPDASTSSQSHVMGTIGYAPPEYGLGNQVSTAGDIYSYGILLLEMLTGKRPVDPLFREGLSLNSYARTALAGGSVLGIVDPMLLHDDVKESCLISLVEVGVQCSSESPQDRMEIDAIIHELLSATVTASS